MYDKVAICEKFVNRNLPLVKLDEKFLYYTQIVEDLHKMKTYENIKGIRINLHPLIDSICDHATDWRNTLGRTLAERTYQNLISLKDHIQVKFHCCNYLVKGLSINKTKKSLRVYVWI